MGIFPESDFGGLPGDFLTFPLSRLTPVDPATTGVVNIFLLVLVLFVQLDVVVVAMVVVALVMVVLAVEFEDEAGDLEVLGDDLCCGDPLEAVLNRLLYAAVDVANDVGKCPSMLSPRPPNKDVTGNAGCPIRKAPGRWAKWAA